MKTHSAPVDTSDDWEAWPLAVEKASGSALIVAVLHEYLQLNPYHYIAGIDTAHGRSGLLAQLQGTGANPVDIRNALIEFAREELRSIAEISLEQERGYRTEAVRALLAQKQIYLQQDKHIHAELLAVQAKSSDLAAAAAARRQYVLLTGKRLTE